MINPYLDWVRLAVFNWNFLALVIFVIPITMLVAFLLIAGVTFLLVSGLISGFTLR